MICEYDTKDHQDMALNDNDRDWIKLKIAEAIRSSNKNSLAALRDWGALAVLVAIAVFVLVEWGKYTEFRTHTDDRLGVMESAVLSIRAFLSASNASTPTGQFEAREVLVIAKKGRIPLPEDAIRKSGQSFIGASKENPKAWPVAIEYLNYASSLKPPVLTASLAPIRIDDKKMVTYYFRSIDNRRPRMFSNNSRLISIEQSAKMELIDTPIRQTSEFGNELVTLVGGTILLDNMLLRHVVFSSVEIHYRGSGLIMEDVSFVNCTFVMENTIPGRDLGDELLAEFPIKSFRIGA